MPPQLIDPAGQVHAPDTHEAPTGQTFAQDPQWETSFVKFTQVPPQLIYPAGQVHTPETHEAPAGQTFAQVPQ